MKSVNWTGKPIHNTSVTARQLGVAAVQCR
jgi:hypothetical protein